MVWRIYLLLLLLLTILGACSRSAPVAGAGPLPSAGVTALPALGKLPAPERGPSLAGPGYLSLPHLTPLAADGSAVEGQLLALDGDLASSATPAYAVYGRQGFAPGVGMTSARITTETVNGEYYVAFANYASGHWQITGPYTASATAEIPASGPPPAADYLSPQGFAYFAVVAGAGNLVRLSSVELGLQGGTAAPAAVTDARYTGQESPYLLAWRRSADHYALDFAGYLLERAPLLMGDFVPLNATPMLQNYYLDATAVTGAKYRIRVAAVDVSGNRSDWFETSGPLDTPVDPVCILQPLATPIIAPQQVTFDLSDSFDPLGQAITQYTIFLDNVHQISSPDPQITMEIHPGCYSVSATVQTADARYGNDAQPLTAYPQWDAVPVVVRDAGTADAPCWSRLQLWRDPATGGLSLCALDSRLPGVSLWRQREAGDFDWAVLPDYEWEGQLEPYSTTEGPLFILGAYEGAPTGLARMLGPDTAEYTQILTSEFPYNIFGVFTGADGTPWAVKLGRSGGPNHNDFVAVPLDDLSAEQLICLGHELFHECSVAQDPVSGIVHLAGNSANIIPDYYPFYAQFDPQTNTTLVEEELDTYHHGTEMEVIPATHDVLMAYYDGTYVQTRLRTGGAWQPPVFVDNIDTNQPCFDLEIGGSAAAILISIGRPRLYSWDGVAWALRNEASYTADVARETALEAVPLTDEFIAATVASTGELYLGQLNLDGTDVQLDKWTPTTGAGPHLSAAAASDGIHVIMRSIPNNTTYHYRSENSGQTFDKLANLPGCRSCECTATSSGELQLSLLSGTNAELQYWADPAFYPVDSATGSFAPLLTQAPEAKARWAAPVASPTAQFELQYGNSTDGYTPSTQPYTLQWIATGTIGPQVLFPRLFCIADYDFTLRQYAFAGLITVPGAVETQLYTPQLYPGLHVVEGNTRVSSCMSASFGYAGPLGILSQVFWSAFGAGDAPQRVTVQADNSYTMAPVPGAWDANPLTGMPMRSVQAALANGYTPVCVAAGIFGEPLRLEWSAGGAWEELPVPASMQGMSKYELVVDSAGAWHLFAHDWRNDRVLCLNTPDPVT